MSQKKMQDTVTSLEGKSFNYLTEVDDVNASMKLLHDSVMSCIDKFAPKHEISVSTNHTHCEPWITKCLRKCAHKQLKLYKKMLNSKNSSDHEKYKQHHDTLKKIKRKAKKDFCYQKCIDYKNNTKKLWKMINNITGKSTNKKTVIDKLKVGKIEESDKHES